MRNQILSASLLLCIFAIATPARAKIAVSVVQNPVISESVTQIGASSWQYSFSITNMANWNSGWLPNGDSVSIVEYSLPYFSDANVTSILNPSGWTHTTVNLDNFNLGNGAQTMVWTIAPGSSGIAGAAVPWINFPTVAGATLGGFSYVASYAPVKGPYAVGFGDGYLLTGDPAIPGSPAALNAGLTQHLSYQVTTVPEPETYALMLAGLGLLGSMARRKKSA